MRRAAASRSAMSRAARVPSRPAAPVRRPRDNSGKPVAIEAENGIEWQQNNRVYIARGNAKATRGDGTVTADTL